jgi:hypothetical protein
MKKKNKGQMLWHMLIIPALGRLKQKDLKFQASLEYRTPTCQWPGMKIIQTETKMAIMFNNISLVEILSKR